MNQKSNVGIVVPTLGTRPEYLQECLRSLKSQSNQPWVCIVAPLDSWPKITEQSIGLFDDLIEDPGQGLPAAINKGIESMGKDKEVVGWIGDDDLLLSEAIESSLRVLRSKNSVVATFGGIMIINSAGAEIRTLRARRSAVTLARLWSNHIYQPGSLIKREALSRIHLLDTELGWAFDLDMFLKLSQIGKVKPNPAIVAKFRWHGDSLSAGLAEGSIREASKVRIKHLPSWLRKASFAWERPHVFLAEWRAKKATL